MTGLEPSGPPPSGLEPPGGSPLPDHVDVVVVGAGLTGAAAAWSAVQRDLSVAVVEQFGIGHPHGSSHGSARIVRRAYPDEFYARLTGEAFELWRELESRSPLPILTFTGGLDHGPQRQPERIAEVLAAAGVRHALLSPEEADCRWPGMRFAGPVLFHPQAGTMDAFGAVLAFLRLAVAAGATVHPHTTVTGIDEDATGVVVQTSAGGVRARRVVLAAGGWLPELLTRALDRKLTVPQVQITQQQAFHFPHRDANPTGSDGQDRPAAWPVTVHKAGIEAYHLPGGRDGGGPDGASGDRKVSQHFGTRSATTASGRSGVIDPAVRRRVVDYVREWLPGLVPEPRAETSCLYTSTANDDFVLDRIGRLVIASPCSGHGAKFAPLIGEHITGLLTGDRAPEPRFSVAGHLAWTA